MTSHQMWAAHNAAGRGISMTPQPEPERKVPGDILHAPRWLADGISSVMRIFTPMSMGDGQMKLTEFRSPLLYRPDGGSWKRAGGTNPSIRTSQRSLLQAITVLGIKVNSGRWHSFEGNCIC